MLQAFVCWLQVQVTPKWFTI